MYAASCMLGSVRFSVSSCRSLGESHFEQDFTVFFFFFKKHGFITSVHCRDVSGLCQLLHVFGHK